jgi:translocation and assembly module TamB
VKYGVGIFNSLGEVTIRYRLMKDLYLEAVSGLTSTVDLLYQFEFD